MKPTTKKTTALLAASALLIAGVVTLIVVFRSRLNPGNTTVATNQQTTNYSDKNVTDSIRGGYIDNADTDDVNKVYAMYDAEFKALDTFSIKNYRTVYDVVDEFDRIRGFSFNKSNMNSICYIKDSLLRNKLIQVELQAFPVLRKIHAANLGKHKWEFDIHISAKGATNNELVLISQAFVNRSNLVQIHEQIQNYAFRLRFKKVIFRHKNDIEVIETNSATDDEL